MGHLTCTQCANQHVRHAGDVVRDVLFEGVHLQNFGERVLQPNAIQHCLALVILSALLLVQLFGRQLLHLLNQALAIIGIERSTKVKLTNLPSLAIALRSRLLIGPGSYSMENSDKYAEAFGTQESFDQKVARSKRKSGKKQSKAKKNNVRDTRLDVPATHSHFSTGKCIALRNLISRREIAPAF